MYNCYNKNIILSVFLFFHLVHAEDNSTDVSRTTVSPLSSIVLNVQKVRCTLDEVREYALNYDYSNDNQTEQISLELFNCTLPFLTDDLLSHLRVVHVNVISSKVVVISAGWLNGLTELQTINVTGNRFTEFQSWSEEELFALVSLHAENNQIATINSKALSQYPNLERLSLASNRIETLPDALFKATSNLKWLNLKNNAIRRIETFSFKSLLKLNELHLENNRIEYINPYALATNAQLRELHLEENRITTIDILLYNLPGLVYVNLSSNHLGSKALEANVFHQNHQLKILDLSRNRLREFQVGSFNGLKSLKVLNVSHNELLYIQSLSLSMLSSVTHWDASNNNLTYIMDNQFVYLGSAIDINLSQNKIDNIQKYSFSDLPDLKVLDLSYNRIFDDDFFTGLTKLQRLDLSYNQFDAFDSTYLQSIGQVDMRANPLGCSWLLAEIAETDFGSIRLGELVGNQSLIGIKAEEIQCNDYDNDDANGNRPLIRNIVVVRKVIKEHSTNGSERLMESNMTDVRNEKETIIQAANRNFKRRFLLLFAGGRLFGHVTEISGRHIQRWRVQCTSMPFVGDCSTCGCTSRRSHWPLFFEKIRTKQ